MCVCAVESSSMSQPTTLPTEQTDHWTLGFFALPMDHCPSLERTRSLLAQNDASLDEVLAALTQQADSMLDAPLLSVVDDDIIPPDGDRRNYTSLGTYWWPNPDAADGLPYVRRDGQRNPQTMIGDFPAMSEMSVHCCVLILAWRLTGDTRYTQKAIAQLRHFFLSTETGMLPNLQYAQRIPGICDGRGIGLIDTHRLVPLVELLPMLRDCDRWTGTDEQGMQRWFSQYLDWFENSELGQKERNEHNNHGTWHDAQAVAFALYTQQPDRAQAVLKQVTSRRIDQHIAADGSQPHEQARTLSLTYSMFNLEGLCSMAIAGQRIGIDLWQHTGPQGQSLMSAINYLAQYAGRFDTWPFEQIKPASSWKLAALLQIAQHCTGDSACLKHIRAITDLTPEQRIFSLIYR